MGTKKKYRQGDVILKLVKVDLNLILKLVKVDLKDQLPVATKEVVLAEGEVTGHRHMISTGAHLFKFDDKMYVKIVEPLAVLRHEEHHRIDLPQCEEDEAYEIVIQRTYSNKRTRAVLD